MESIGSPDDLFNFGVVYKSFDWLFTSSEQSLIETVRFKMFPPA
jgi:hypothetical protein